MERRDLLAAGGLAALCGVSAYWADASAAAGPASAGEIFGKPVTAFGAEPGSDRDQTPAFQKALLECANAGAPLVVPPGIYRVGRLNLPARVAIFGAPSSSRLIAAREGAIFTSKDGRDIVLRGLVFEGQGAFFENCQGLSVRDCRFIACAGVGLDCQGSNMEVGSNRFIGCAESGLVLAGDGAVMGNLVDDGGKFGLRLGGRDRLGTFSALNNKIAGARVGIAVSNAEGGYGFIAMNMITGAREGGIRALNGDELIGKDLVRNFSADSFRYLAIAANVSV